MLFSLLGLLLDYFQFTSAFSNDKFKKIALVATGIQGQKQYHYSAGLLVLSGTMDTTSLGIDRTERELAEPP